MLRLVEHEKNYITLESGLDVKIKSSCVPPTAKVIQGHDESLIQKTGKAKDQTRNP